VRVYNRALSADEVKALYQQREEVGNAYVSQKAVRIDSRGNINITNSIAASSVSIGEALKLKPGSAPANPEEGWLFMNSSDHHLYYYNSTDWVII